MFTVFTVESERADLGPKRTDFRPERADSRPERADIRPERAWGEGRTDARTNKITPVFYRTLPKNGSRKKVEEIIFTFGTYKNWNSDCHGYFPSQSIMFRSLTCSTKRRPIPGDILSSSSFCITASKTRFKYSSIRASFTYRNKFVSTSYYVMSVTCHFFVPSWPNLK